MVGALVTVFGPAWCNNCVRIRLLLERYGVPYKWIDVDADLAAHGIVLSPHDGLRSMPTIVFPDGSLVVDPSSCELAARLRLLAA